MSIFQTPAEKTVAQYAAGLYGVAIGAPTNTQVLAQATNNGLNAVFNQYFDLGFEPVSSAVVAALVVRNVGIVDGQNGLTAANVAAAVTYVKAQLDTAAPSHTEGQTISDVLSAFSTMTGDLTFGAAARAWNTQIDKNLAYTNSGALKDVPIAQAVVLAPTYAVAVDKATIVEGESVAYTITATGLAAGTEIAYSVTGTGNALASTKVGIATVNAAGNAVVTVSTADNFVLNDAGSLTFKLLNGATTLASAANVAVTNNDNAATYAVAASSPTISEGDSVSYDITTTGVAPGTDLVYVVTGTNNAAASTQFGLATVNVSGKATVTINTFNNQVASDAGVLSFKLISGEVTLASANVNVQNDDVVVAPTLHAAVTAEEVFGTGGINEGDIVQFNVATTGYPVGTVLPYTVSGTNNVSDVVKAGFITIGVGGVATVQVQTHDNAVWGDAGQLTFNLGSGLATKTVDVGNDDTEVINNTYTLTVDSDRITDTNTGNDIFMATVGNTHPTLTSGDKLNGGTEGRDTLKLNGGTEGRDTLHIKVDGDDAVLPEMNINTKAFQNIEHVIVDVSDHYLDLGTFDSPNPGGHGYVYNTGSLPDSSDDSTGVALDAKYFDTDGKLETLTIVSNKDAKTESDSYYEDVFVHKDMTLEYVGSGVKDDANTLWTDVILSKDVKNLTINLDGVGGDYWADYSDYTPGDEYDSGPVIFLTQEADSSTLETLTVAGTLAATSFDLLRTDNIGSAATFDIGNSFIYDVWNVDATLTLDSEAYGVTTPQPKTLTISLEKTADVDSIQLVLGGGFSENEGFGLNISSPDFFLPTNGLMAEVTELDMSGTNANITTYMQSAYLYADAMDIKLGTGDDLFALDIQPLEMFTNKATAITFDLSASLIDKDTIILSNDASSHIFMEMFSSGSTPMDGEDDFGGNVVLDTSYRDVDLTEDMITLDNFNTIKDKLSMDLNILHGFSGASEGIDDHSYVGHTFDYESGSDVQKAVKDGVDSARREDEKFFKAVESVATYLVNKAEDISINDASSGDVSGATMQLDEVDQYYAAVFQYEGDTYLYVDTNRNGWDYTGSDADLNNLGLSTGDTLVKLTGITSLPVGFDLTAKHGYDFVAPTVA